jgi:hypothetical protein
MEGLLIAAFYNGQVTFTFYECPIKDAEGKYINLFEQEEIVLEPGIHVPAHWPEKQCVVSFLGMISAKDETGVLRALQQNALLAGVSYFYEPATES